MFKLEKLPGDISVPKGLPSACFVIWEYGEEILLMMPKTCGAMSKRALNTIVSVSVPVRTDYSVFFLQK